MNVLFRPGRTVRKSALDSQRRLKPATPRIIPYNIMLIMLFYPQTAKTLNKSPQKR